MLEQLRDNKIIYGTKIGFIGLGKLGMPCAEAIARKGFDVTGYDTGRVSTDLTMKETIKELVADRDIVFVAVPTPHDMMAGNLPVICP